MKKKFTLLLGLVSACMACFIAGCANTDKTTSGGGNNNVEIVDGSASKVEEAYTPNYTHKVEVPKNAGVTLDGKIDSKDTLWNNKGYMWQSFLKNNTNASKAKMKFTAVPTEEGVFFASVIYDQNVCTFDDKGTVAYMHATGWEFQYLNIAKGEDIRTITTVETATRRRAFFMDANGNLNGDEFPGFIGVGKSYVEGKVNSGNTQYVSMEAFLPYSALNIDMSKGIPDKFYIMPTFYAIAGSGNGGAVEKCFLDPYPWVYPSAYYEFDADGYTQEIPETATLGAAKCGYPQTGGWDVSQITSNTVTATGNKWQQLFFSDIYEADFDAQATISIPSNRFTGWGNEWGTPYNQKDFQTGFLFYNNVGESRSIVVSGASYNTSTKSFDGLQIKLTNKSASDEVSLVTVPFSGSSFTLKVEKRGANFKVYINGSLASQTSIDTMNGGAYPALFSYQTQATFSNCTCLPAGANGPKYTREFYFMNDDYMTYAQIPVEAIEYAPTGTAVSMPNSYTYNGEIYTLDTEATANNNMTTNGNVVAGGSTVIGAYYSRSLHFQNVNANYKYLVNGQNVYLEADAVVGANGQRFNGFVLSQGMQSSVEKKVSFIFNEKSVMVQHAYGWDDDGYRYEVRLDKDGNPNPSDVKTGDQAYRDAIAATGTTGVVASGHILNSATPTKIRLELRDGLVKVYAGGTLYVTVDLATLNTRLSLGFDMNASFDVGLYGFDCNVGNQNVTFSKISHGQL